MRVRLATRRGVLFGAMLVVALLLSLPMRLALGAIGVADEGLTARRVVGSVWSGKLREAKLGDVALGDLNAALSPVQLLVGRARVDVAGRDGDGPTGEAARRLRGAFGLTSNSAGVDDVTAHLPLGDALAPLPVSALDLDDVTVRFEDGRCRNADGQVRATIAPSIRQLTLPAGMAGTVRCDGGALLVDLASPAGTDRVELALRQDGTYRATLTTPGGDPAAASVLLSSGFRQTARGYQLALEGRF